MKKILFLMFILCIPFSVKAEEEYCDGQKLKEIIKEIENVTFEIEYLEEGSLSLSDEDVSGKFKVSSPNMPNHVRAIFVSGTTGYVVSKEIYSALSGGVYDVEFRHTHCPLQNVKRMSFYIPFYKQYESENVWFDGTYENKLVNYEEEEKVSAVLIIILIVLLVTLSLGIAFIILKKRRNVKWNEN